MADLYFKVEADYQELIRLQQEVKKLEHMILGLNLKITPQIDIANLTNQLQDAKNRMEAIARQAAIAGAQFNAQQASLARLGGSMSQTSQKASGLSRGMHDISAAAKEMTNTFVGINGGLSNFLRQFSLATLSIKGLYSAFDALKGSVSTIMSFQSANSTLQAILGVSDDAMKGFKATAEELGRSTAFTASQVTQLQIELSKLGFNEGAIHAMERPVLDFAQAVGTDLGNAAATTGAALRMFGVEEKDYAEQTVKYTNAMATATMRSALDFRAISENLATFGPMAHSVGMEIQDVLALFGILKNSGVEASTAMTSLRNIFTKVSQGKIEGMGEVHSLDDFISGLEKMQAMSKDPGKGMKMIGPRGGTQFITLIQQYKEIGKLRDQIEEGMNRSTTGTMGEKMVNNLAGQLKMLSSAWEGFILTFQESDGIAKDFVAKITDGIGKLRELIASDGDWSTEKIEKYATAIGVLLTMIAVYKSEVALVNAGRGIYDKYQMTQAQQQIAQLERSIALQTEENATIGKGTAMVQGRIAAIQEQLMMQRQVALQAAVAAPGAESAREVFDLRREQEKLAVIREESLERKKQVQILLQEAAAERAKSNSDIRLAERKEAQALRLIETEKVHQIQLQAAEKRVIIQEDALLAKIGQQNLVTQRLTTAELEKQMGKASKMKTIMAMTGLDLLTNPYVLLAAAITAVGYAIYDYVEHADQASIQQGILNEQIAEYQNLCSQNKSKAHELIRTMSDQTATVYQQTKAYKELLELYRQFEGYSVSEILSMSKEERDTILNQANQDNELQMLENRKKALEELRNSGKGLQLIKIDGDAEELEKRYKLPEGSLKDVIDNVGILGSLQNALTEAISKTNMEYKMMVQEISEAESQADTLEMTKEEAEDLAKTYNKIQGILEGFVLNDGIKTQEGYISDMGAAVSEAQKRVDELRKKLQKTPMDKKIKFALENAEKTLEDAKTLQALLEQVFNGAISQDVIVNYIEGKTLPKQGGTPFVTPWGGASLTPAFNGGKQGGTQMAMLNFNPQTINARANQKKAEETPPSHNDSKSNADAVNERNRRLEEEYKYNEALKRVGEERKETEVQMEFSIAQARINAMKDGAEKILEQRNLDNKKAIHDIEKQGAERLKKYKAEAKSLFDQNPDNKKQTAKDKTSKKEGKEGRAAKHLSDAEIEATEEYKAFALQVEIEIAQKKRELAQKEAKELYKDYEDAGMKRIALEEKVNASIAAMRQRLAEEQGKITSAKSVLDNDASTDEQRSDARIEIDIAESNINNINRAILEATHQLNKERIDAEVDFLKKYGTLEQQRIAIAKEAEEKLRNETDPNKRAMIRIQADEDKRKAESEEALKSIDWEGVFGDLQGYSASYLETIKKQAETLRDSGKITNIEDYQRLQEKITEINERLSGTTSLFSFVSDESLRVKRALLDVANAEKLVETTSKRVADAQTNVSSLTSKVQTVTGYSASDSNTLEAYLAENKDNLTSQAYNDLSKALEDLRVAETELRDATDENTKAQGKLRNANQQAQKRSWKDLTPDERTSKIQDVFSKVQSNVGSLGDLQKSLGLGDIKGLTQGVSGLNDAMGAASDFMSGNYVGALAKGVSAVMNFGETFGLWSNSNREAVEKRDKELVMSQTALQQSLDRLTDKIGKGTVLDSYNNYNQAERTMQTLERNAQQRMLNNASLYDGDHSVLYKFNKNFRGSGFQQRLSSALGKRIDSLEDVIASASKLNELYSTQEGTSLIEELYRRINDVQSSGNYNNLTQDLTDFMNTYNEEAYKNLHDTLQEAVTGVSFDSFKDKFKSSLMDVRKDVRDFSNDFTQQMTQSILDARIEELYGEEIKKLYNRWSDAFGDNDVTEAEIRELQMMQDDLTQRMIDTRDKVFASTGYSESNSEARETINGIKSVSDDTGNSIVGRTTAIQLGVEGNRSVLDAILGQMSGVNTNLAALSDMASESISIADESRTILANSYLELQRISGNTESIIRPIQSLAEDMALVRNHFTEM